MTPRPLVLRSEGRYDLHPPASDCLPQDAVNWIIGLKNVYISQEVLNTAWKILPPAPPSIILIIRVDISRGRIEIADFCPVGRGLELSQVSEETVGRARNGRCWGVFDHPIMH